MHRKHARRGSFIAIAITTLFMFSGAAHAQCTPDGMARYRALTAQLLSTAARIKAGDCSLIPKWKGVLAAKHAIMRRSQRQTVPYTCNVNFEYPPIPSCGGPSTAKARQAKQAAADPIPAAPANPATQKSASCSDITGTNSKSPAAKNCSSANSALIDARAAREQNSTRSAQHYKKAADAYRRAGDHAQADAVLREAAGPTVIVVSAPNPFGREPVAGPPSGSRTGASAPLAAAPAASAPRRGWSGSGEREDCDSAGYLDRQTAAWYNMCVPFDPAELEKSRPNAYKPPISPQALTAWAIDECKNVQWDAKRQCNFDAKLRRLLADDFYVRAECSSLTGNDQIDCVDAVFLYGPGAYQGNRAEQENLKRKLALSPTYLPDRTSQPATVPAQSAPRDGRCPPGQGMKPTPGPGPFGAWSCQPLGVIWLAPNRPKPDPATPQADAVPNAPDPLQAFEERVNHVAASAVVAGAKKTGAQSSAQERETCMAAAFAAVHSTLKGGNPPVPEQCRPMTNAARVELAYYAGAHIDTISNLGTEELLSHLNARNPNSGVLNSGVLGPPRQAAKMPDADCTQAESHWKAAEDLKLIAIYEDHLARFSTCNFAAIAAARIQQLKKN